MKQYLLRLIDSTGMGRAGRRGRVPVALMCERTVLNGRRCAFMSAQDGQLSSFGGSSGTSFSTNPFVRHVDNRLHTAVAHPPMATL